ncbi:MAG: hypothetical protein KDB27_07535, partial [Planctomycetales bacterium]|nr:hypothetical protein [Planctomycetales bacterium]
SVATWEAFIEQIDAIDFDGDGKLDIMFSELGGSVGWFKNEGGGEFLEAKTIWSSFQDYALADIDGDGHENLIAIDSNGQAAWYRYTPNGIVKAGSFTLDGGLWQFFDADGDGDSDFGSLSGIYENDGTGSFAKIVESGLRQSHELFIDRIEFVDWDSDGDFDLFYHGLRQCGGVCGLIGLLENRQGIWVPGLTKLGTVDIASVGDVTDDAYADLIIRSPWGLNQNVQLLQGIGFGVGEARNLTDLPLLPHSARLRDVDIDGDLDVLVSSMSNVGATGWPGEVITRFDWYENLGNWQFGPRQPVAENTSHIEATPFTPGDSGDLDGDGVAEFVWTFDRKVFIRSYPTGELNSFELELDISARIFPNDLRVIDFNKDGSQDVMLYGDGSSSSFVQARIWLNDGSGNKFEEHIYEFDDDCRGLGYIKDADGDGDMDLVRRDVLIADGNQTESFTWYENTGGAFQSCSVMDQYSNQLLSSESADIDADGDIDRVWYHWERGVFAYENRLVGDSNDDGQFDSQDLLLVLKAGEYEDQIGGNSTFEEGDWNGDGDFDSADIVYVFRTANYVREARPSRPMMIDRLFGNDESEGRTKRRILSRKIAEHEYSSSCERSGVK